MRVYFHLKKDADTIIDPDGADVTDLAEALVEARRAIEEMRAEDWLEAQSWSGWKLQAADQSGHLLFSFDLSE